MGGELVNSRFIIDPRVSFACVKVAHEWGREFTHDTVVTPAFVSKAQGKCNESREEVVLVDSTVDEDCTVDGAVISR